MFFNNVDISEETISRIKEIVKFSINTISVIGKGASSIALEINKKYIFLIGTNDRISNNFHKQFLLLPKINNSIQYQLPCPIWCSNKDTHFQFGYFGYKKIIGVNNNQRNYLIINHDSLSTDVANFLFKLHNLNTNTFKLESCDFKYEDLLLKKSVMPKLKNLFSLGEYNILEKWWINYFHNSNKYVLGSKFVHGDFHFHNFILSSDLKRLTGVVDFEGCGIGNPANDLASLNYINKDFLHLVLGKYSYMLDLDISILNETVQLQWEKREFSNLKYTLDNNDIASVKSSIDKVRKGHLFK